MSPRRALQRGAALARVSVAALSLSAAALVGLALHEGYSDQAYQATPHEAAKGINTLGFGLTQHPEDGRPVQPTDRTTPTRALVALLADIDARQQALRACIGPEVALHPWEWDAIVSWAYNVGVPAACRSTLVRKLRAGDHAGACAELLRWDRQAGRVLPGLTKRRQAEHRQCLGAGAR